MRERFEQTMAALEAGTMRVATPKADGQWEVHPEIKEIILSGFRLGQLTAMGPYIDKDTYPITTVTKM